MGSDGSGRSGFTEEIAFPAARAAERLGRYELLAPLGKGGMASVFLARLRGPSGFEKLLAIKRIHPALTEDPRFVDMFLDEARVAAALQHPNIAQVFELGHEGPVYFLAMEYLHGEHLGDVLGRAAKDGAPLPVELACWIVARVAEALHHAHEATDALGRPLSIIHRDVSPQNIFVTYAGNAKLTDFGVAKASSNVVETDTGTVKGKFAYMAPEQALGHEIDRRVDVFALGTVLWEALAGRRLFRAATDAQTLLNVTRCEVPPLPPIRREVSEDLDSIVQCALAADPSGRFETAGALARALSRQCTDVSAEDVRAWMHAHFRAEEERKRAFVTGVAEGEEPTVVQEGSSSGVVARGGRSEPAADASSEAPTRAAPRAAPKESPAQATAEPARSRVPTLPDGHAEATHAVGERAVITEPAAPVARARRSSPALLVAALAVLLLAGGGVAAWLALDSMTDDARAAEAARERASSAAPPSPGPLAREANEAEPAGEATDPAPPPPAGEPPLEDEGAAQAPELARGLDPPPIDPAPAPIDEVAAPQAPAPAPRAPRGPALPPGTLQVSIAPAHAGPRYGWVRVGGERRPLPAVLRDVPAGPTWVHYQIGEAPERRARVRVEPGRTTIVQLPR